MNSAGNTGVRLGKEIREQFPIFATRRSVGGGRVLPLSYLDSAASAQKPRVVIERLQRYLSEEHANIHRGAYALSANATQSYDLARARVASFLSAASERSVIFTRGTTEAMNLVAGSLQHRFSAQDTIVLTLLEHHSNIVPWQLLAKRTGAKIVFAEIGSDVTLSRESFSALLKRHKPKLVSLTALANAFGTILPVAELVAEAKAAGAITVVDAAQSVVHMPTDVSALGCDFLAFSGHKIYGPTGIGVLYAREEMFDLMEPYQGGGDMISEVTVTGSSWAEPPQKFEAGTPAIAEAIGLGTAIEFVEGLGWDLIRTHDEKVFSYGWEKLARVKGVTLYGPRSVSGSQHSESHASIISFNVEGVHPHDLSTVADSFNVQIRAGHHCAIPALRRLGIPSSARASLGVYSCEEDFDFLAEAIVEARRIFA